MTQRSNAGRPSILKPASRKIISDSVKLCDAEVSFLHIQLTGTNVRLPNKHKNPSWAWFRVFQVTSKVWVLGKTNRQCWAVLPTWQYCRYWFVWWMYEINLAKRLSQAWVHFVTARASLLTDHKMSGLSRRAKYKHFKTMCDHTFDNSQTDSSSSFLNWWSFKQRVETFYSCSNFVFAISQYRSTHLRACPSMSQDHAAVFAWGFSHSGNFSVATVEIRASNIFAYFPIMISFGLQSRWVHPKSSWSRNDVGSSRSTFFIDFFHMGAIFCFCPAILMSSTYPDKSGPCFRWTNRHSQFGTFSHPSSNRISSNCLSHNTPGNGCPYRFRSRTITGSSMFDHDFGPLCHVRRIHTSGHSDFGILSNLGASS